MALSLFMKWLGRGVFWLILGTQLGLLLAYPIDYGGDIFWVSVAWAILLYASAAVLFGWPLYLMIETKPSRYYPYVWLVYIVLLIIYIVIIFGLLEHADMQNDRFFNTEVLKAVFCFTPFLLLLLVNTADHSKYYKEVISKMSVTMTIHLFDAIDMIDIVLIGKEHGSGSLMPKGFERAMIALACGNLLLSAWELAQNKSANGFSTKIRLGVVILFNLAFLIIRAVVVSHYQGTNETIFIAKNIITIITSISQIPQTCQEEKQKEPGSSALLLPSDEED